MKKRPAVLVVDDDHQFTAVIEEHLAGAGLSCVVAFDPIQGFMIARRDKPRLILLDIAMPAGGGLVLLERLAKTNGTKHIPVIVVTALQEAGLNVECREKGAVGFLRKPLDREKLLAAVQDVLKLG